MKKWINKKEQVNKKKSDDISSGINSGAWMTDDIFTGTSTATGLDNSNINARVDKMGRGIVKIPFLGRMDQKKQKIISLSLMSVCFISLFGTIFTTQTKDNTPYIQSSVVLVSSMLDRTKDNFPQALTGTQNSLTELKKIQDGVNQNINSLSKMVDEGNGGTLTEIKKNWSLISNSIDEIFANKDLLVNTRTSLDMVNSQATDITKQIQTIMNKTKNPNDWYLLNSLLFNIQSISMNGNILLTKDKSNNFDAATALWNLNNSTNSLINNSLNTNNLTPQTSEFMNELKNKYVPVNNMISGVIDNIVKTNKMKLSLENIDKAIVAEKVNLNNLHSAYQFKALANENKQIFIIVLSILSLLSLMLSIIVFNNSEKRFSDKIKLINHDVKISLNSLGRDLSVIEKGNLLNKVKINEKENEKIITIKEQINELVDNIRRKIVELSRLNEDASVRTKSSKDILNDFKRKERENSEKAELVKLQVKRIDNIVSSYNSQLKSILREDMDNYVANVSTSIKTTSLNAGEIIEALDDTSKRTQRLLDSSQKIQEYVNVLIELSQRVSILSTQAALQAAKRVNDNSNGFSLISEEMKDVADKINLNIQKVNSLASTTHTDINLTKDAVDVIKVKSNDIAWNNDIAQHNLNEIRDKDQSKTKECSTMLSGLEAFTHSTSQLDSLISEIIKIPGLEDISKSLEHINAILNAEKKAIEEYNIKSTQEVEPDDDFNEEY